MNHELFSLEAERAVLGGLVLNNAKWCEVANMLRSSDFADQKNKVLFETIAAIAKEQQPFDALLISQKLQDSAKLELVGGDSYIFNILNNTPSSLNVVEYAKIVKAKSEQRALIKTADEIRQAATHGNIELVKNCIAQVYEITNKNNQWQEPIPLVAAADNAVLAYPTHLLPDAIRGAVEEYQSYEQQPMPIIACSALANISLACQGLADIARDEKLISPLSLYFVVVADSGERKTAADKIFTDGTKHWEQIARDDLQAEIKKNQAERDAWQAQREGALAAIRNPRHKIENIEELKQKLKALDLQEPQKIVLPNLYHEEVNAESLAYNLAAGWQSSSLWSDEAGIVVGGHGMNQENITKFTTLLNRLWDGNAYCVNRKTSESFTIEGRRLTCSLMMQPAIFDQLINRCDNISRGSGFLARCLITNPPSTMGNRFYKKLPPHTPHLNNFHERILQLLSKPLPLDNKKRLAPKVLQLSEAAKNLWINFHDEVEVELRSVGEFWDIKDSAAKAAENAARLAGSFHVFCNYSGDLVDAETMQRAAGIIAWHLSEIKRLMAALTMSQEYKDAQLLWNWLTEKQYREIKVNDVLQLAPSRLRTKEKRDGAIKTLQRHNYLIIVRRSNVQWLIINPNCKEAI